MSPVLELGGLIIGSAFRQYRLHSKFKKASAITARAVERVAEAEVRFADHEQMAYAAANKLKIRANGIINETFKTQYYDIFRPYEGPDGKIRKTLLQDLDAIETLRNLKEIRQLENKAQVQQLPGYQKLSGSSAVVSYILFGKMSEANRQLDTAATQSEKSRLIATHTDTLCTILDRQRENYERVSSTLAALNVALMVSIQKYNDFSKNLVPLLGSNGRFRADVMTKDIENCLTPLGCDQQKVCINIAKVLSAIMKTPIFNENAEIQAEAEKALKAGEEALKKINQVENGRKQTWQS